MYDQKAQQLGTDRLFKYAMQHCADHEDNDLAERSMHNTREHICYLPLSKPQKTNDFLCLRQQSSSHRNCGYTFGGFCLCAARLLARLRYNGFVPVAFFLVQP